MEEGVEAAVAREMCKLSLPTHIPVTGFHINNLYKDMHEV